MKTGSWDVWMKPKGKGWMKVGITETNYPYAVKYWDGRTRERGMKFELREVLA
jgi:hypothetical protein